MAKCGCCENSDQPCELQTGNNGTCCQTQQPEKQIEPPRGEEERKEHAQSVRPKNG